MPWPSLEVGGGPSRVPTGARLPLPMPVAFWGSLPAVLGPADSAAGPFRQNRERLLVFWDEHPRRKFADFPPLLLAELVYLRCWFPNVAMTSDFKLGGPE